jgi:hypothetical protein
MDRVLRGEGFAHLIYLSPVRAEFEGQRPRSTVTEALRETALSFRNLRDAFVGMTAASIDALYHDGVHLSPIGHAAWAKVIRTDLEPAIAARSN